MNYETKKAYENYFEKACKVYADWNPPIELIQKAKLCYQTNGCFSKCVSSCIPPQKISLLDTFKNFGTKECIDICEPGCVCSRGYEFDEKKGCSKK